MALSFPNKRSGDRLTELEFARLEREADRLHDQSDLGIQRKRSTLHAQAHEALPPYSIFSVSSAVKSVPVPVLNTAKVDDGTPLLLLTNGPFSIPAGQQFTAEVIDSTYPRRIRTGGNSIKIGWPCGARFSTALEEEHITGLVCLSAAYTFDGVEVVWVIRQSQKMKFSAIATTNISEYDADTKVLGSGLASIQYETGVSTDPETDLGPWIVPVWNTHSCDILEGDLIDLTPVVNVGWCLSHPEFVDEEC